MTSDQDLLELLHASLVRIDVAGEVSGTGFIVAPGQILTCYHVIAPALSRPGGITLVQVIDPAADPTAEPETPLEMPLLAKLSDLALLRVPTRPSATPVLLDVNVQVDDSLYVYGFTPAKPQGTPATLTVEGIQGGPPRLVTLKGGQVVSGLSGAPVLNRRTGMVCGVLKRTRDIQSDLGGLAVPIDTVLAQFQRLRIDNRAVLQSYSDWRKAMTAQQRGALDQAHLASGTPSELIVDVGQVADRWIVSTTLPASAGTSPEVWCSNEQVDLNVLRPDVAKLFRMLKASGRLTPVQQSHALGQALTKALWNDGVRERLHGFLNDTSNLAHISLRFREDVDEDLQFLPWETMFIPASQPAGTDAIRIAAHKTATFTRVRHTNLSSFCSETESLQVVIVVAPGDTVDASNQIQCETKSVEKIVRKVTDTCRTVPSTPDERATPLALLNLLKTTPRTTVLHYIGYGHYENGGKDQIQLDGAPDERQTCLSAAEFAKFLPGEPPLLMILQPLTTSEGDVPVDFSTLAPDLLLAGVAAVLAFPLPVDPEAAQSFFGAFYQRLAAGSSVRAAVQYGRTHLEQGRRPWAFPALMMRSPGDLQLTSPAATASAPQKAH